MKRSHLLKFGIGCQGKMVIIFGKPVQCTLDQAEFIVMLLELGKWDLYEGHYLCYDFA